MALAPEGQHTFPETALEPGVREDCTMSVGGEVWDEVGVAAAGVRLGSEPSVAATIVPTRSPTGVGLREGAGTHAVNVRSTIRAKPIRRMHFLLAWKKPGFDDLHDAIPQDVQNREEFLLPVILLQETAPVRILPAANARTQVRKRAL
jgi:hypothetical protein